MANWPYFELDESGQLCERRRGVPVPVNFGPAYPKPPTFKDSLDAEAWLVENDIRGNVR